MNTARPASTSVRSTTSVVIAGSGPIGRRVATVLDALGHAVHVIDPDQEKLRRLPDHLVPNGIADDVLRLDALRRAGIDEANFLFAATDLAELNVGLAIACRRVFAVPRVVARVHEPAVVTSLRSLRVETICVTALVASALRSMVERIATTWRA